MSAGIRTTLGRSSNTICGELMVLRALTTTGYFEAHITQILRVEFSLLYTSVVVDPQWRRYVR